jgi:hypothetical protein
MGKGRANSYFDREKTILSLDHLSFFNQFIYFLF